MQEHRAEIRRRGAEVVAIGQGSGGEAARHCARHGVGYPCLGDAEHASYRAFELDRASWWGITVQPFLENASLGLERIRRADLRASMSPRSDVRRLGGVAVVDRRGTLRLLHRARKTDDFPPLAEILRALDEAAAA